MRDETLHKQKVERTSAQHLISDVDIIALDVTRFGNFGHCRRGLSSLAPSSASSLACNLCQHLVGTCMPPEVCPSGDTFQFIDCAARFGVRNAHVIEQRLS